MNTQTNRPIEVNQDLVGRTYMPTETYAVTALKIAEFAAATGSDHPAHTSEQAARALGYSGVVAPPTFAVIPAQRAEFHYVNAPESGIDFSRVVHAEESFEYSRPIVAGDILSTTLTVEKIAVRAQIATVSTRADIEDVNGEHVCTVRSTLAVRGEGK